jgi:hypothetical protein
MEMLAKSIDRQSRVDYHSGDQLDAYGRPQRRQYLPDGSPLWDVPVIGRREVMPNTYEPIYADQMPIIDNQPPDVTDANDADQELMASWAAHTSGLPPPPRPLLPVGPNGTIDSYDELYQAQLQEWEYNNKYYDHHK